MNQPLSFDTSPDVEQRQTHAWREMSFAEKADIIVGLSAAAREMCWAGVRHRYPQASPREQFLRVAIATLGADLARQAYPEIVTLELV